MERLCKITLEISGYRQDQEKEIIKACMVEWNFGEDDFFHQPDNDGLHMILGASAIGCLYADYDEKDIIGRLERAVWRINGSVCHVKVRAMRLNKSGVIGVSIDEELQIA